MRQAASIVAKYAGYVPLDIDPARLSREMSRLRKTIYLKLDDSNN